MLSLNKSDEASSKFEDDFIHLLTNSSLFFGRNPNDLMILTYFFTRQNLTQDKLKKLTKLSSGKISQELNELLRNDVIKITKKLKNGQRTYTMENPGEAFFPYLTQLIIVFNKWEKEFMKIKQEMIEKQNELINLKGYNEILEIINSYLCYVPLTSKLLDELKGLKET